MVAELILDLSDGVERLSLLGHETLLLLELLWLLGGKLLLLRSELHSLSELLLWNELMLLLSKLLLLGNELALLEAGEWYGRRLLCRFWEAAKLVIVSMGAQYAC
jgi:hypothetical protein